MDEFDLIRTYFAPLAPHASALGLKDDAALLAVPPGEQLVATTDMIVGGVHFVGDESPGLIAQKLLRMNLSDLAAMGATPYAFLLALSVPKHTRKEWFAAFARGLKEDMQRFNVVLVGGDTTASKQGITLCLTALGLMKKGNALLRSGAKAGDGIFVSGTLGDAALGLGLAHKKKVKTAAEKYLLSRYQLPEPRLALGKALISVATAAMDISDGLVQDLGHICTASHCGAEINIEAIPLSKAAQNYAKKLDILPLALTGGDDYELLFTAPLHRQNALNALSKKLGLPITRIGCVTKSKGVIIKNKYGNSQIVKRGGYKHF